MKLGRDQELDLIAAIERDRSSLSRTYRNLFDSLARADAAELWREDGCRDMSEWVAGRFGISKWQARRWVAAAHRLEHLPVIAAAFAAGEVGVEKIVELTRYATRDTESDLVKWAKKVLPATIREQADKACAAGLEEVREVEKSRYLRWWWDDYDGVALQFHGRLPAVEGAQFVNAIDGLASELASSPERADEVDEPNYSAEELEEIALWSSPRDFFEGRVPELPPSDLSLEHRRADALALLVSGGRGSSSEADATVVVHADLAALQGDGTATSVEKGPVLPAASAGRLACDCRLEVVAYDGGRTVGIKRARRTPPRWLRRQMLKRDHGTCLFPGCGRRVFLQAHHIVFWEHGGLTNLDNLATVCHFHHKLVHEYGWSLRLGSIPGTAEWFRPDGRRYEPQPVLRAPPAAELPLAV